MIRCFSYFATLILTVSFGAAFANTASEYETLWQGKDVIWGLDFLPDGRAIFTERGGAMRIFDPKTKSATQLSGVPKVFEKNQCGLLDVRVHPDFSKNGFVYFSYCEPVGSGMTTTLARAKLQRNKLEDLKKLFSAKNPSPTGIQFGSRIEFDGAHHIFLTIGDFNERERAQNLGEDAGKILRLNEDGSVPKDNPFNGRKGAEPEIWSYGHRSPEGLSLDAASGKLWEAEMGPKGGDELNLIERGRNYGWPEITYGREYYGPKIGTTEKPGMEQPVVYWVPSISPSGIAVYTGSAFPEWKGNIFLACLSGQRLQRVVVDANGKVVSQESLLDKRNTRFRSVRTGPDGTLWLTTDEGAIARLKPTGS